MSNYYEILKVQPTAAPSEIETAVESQYNQWRRLVTHHDPKIVEEANRSLRLLEQIRSTLTDSVRRAAYDEGIGLGGAAGGLADPEALLRSAAPPPMFMPAPPAPQAAAFQPAGQRVDAWVCPKCQTANAVGTTYCKECGGQLGINCPQCGRLTEAAAKHCASCGAHIQEAINKQLEAKKSQLEEYLQTLIAQILQEQRTIQALEMVVETGKVQMASYSDMTLASNSLSKQPGATSMFVMLIGALVVPACMAAAIFGDSDSPIIWIVTALAIMGAVAFVLDINKTRTKDRAAGRIIFHREQLANLEQQIKQIQSEIEGAN